jgi:hypothetical protein
MQEGRGDMEDDSDYLYNEENDIRQEDLGEFIDNDIRQGNLREFVDSVVIFIFILFAYLFGSSLAMIISYFHNYSIPWAIGHGILSWAYVLYFAIFK